MNASSLPRPADAITGVWQLLSRQDHDSTGTRHIDPALGAAPLGILCFGGGWFAAQFMNRERHGMTAGPVAASAAAADNNSGAVGGYDAYFGTYEVDEAGRMLTVHLEGALSPGDVGRTLTRAIELAADRLTIRLDTKSAGGIPVTRTLVFGRLS